MRRIGLFRTLSGRSLHASTARQRKGDRQQSGRCECRRCPNVVPSRPTCNIGGPQLAPFNGGRIHSREGFGPGDVEHDGHENGTDDKEHGTCDRV
jgi:hypothetical protein